MAILGGFFIWKHGKKATWEGGARTISLLFLCIWVPMAAAHVLEASPVNGAGVLSAAMLIPSSLSLVLS